MRDEEVNVSEPDKDVSLKDTKTQKKRGRKKEKQRELSNFHLYSLGSCCFVGASNGMEK